MMPSVIPARLQFQCGHAALVTLPRVKGETATQRNDRVAREKSAALGRQCDFCAPVNGTAHIELADALEKTTPVEELAVIVAAAPQPVAAEPMAVPVAEEHAPVAVEPPAVVPEPAAAQVVKAEVVKVHTVPVETVNGTNGRAARPVRRARAPRLLKDAEMVARGQRFLVHYRLERVLRANSIHDALRQVATYGPGEVVAITRED